MANEKDLLAFLYSETDKNGNVYYQSRKIDDEQVNAGQELISKNGRFIIRELKEPTVSGATHSLSFRTEASVEAFKAANPRKEAAASVPFKGTKKVVKPVDASDEI